MTNKIHWLGAGLSSTPGIKSLAEQGHALIVWNRTLSKAQAMLAGTDIDIRELSHDALEQAVSAGDVVVSMLPATKHIEIAEFCLRHGCHFVSSSYISPEMQSLNEQAKQAELCFVNEVGLDPGIDHLLAHLLVEDYKASDECSTDNQVYFRSYCGGFPKIVNDFRYKFSWSPLGVLKALKSPAQWQSEGKAKTSRAPWEALSRYSVDFGDYQETFQAYPNRDSLPFKKQYHFSPEWDVQEFVRGTLRLDGWSDAWQYLFDEIEKMSPEESEARLTEISAELDKKYAYDEGEPDRVVMAVELEIKRDNNTVWHKSYTIDEAGNDKGQAMARLVSLPVSLAIQSVLSGEISAGVSAAPDQTGQINSWLDKLANLGEKVHHKNHLV